MTIDTLTDAQVVAIATPIMNNLMEASTRIDHAAHTRDFTARLKAIVTPAHLDFVCRRYQAERGFFGERKLTAVFRRPNGAAILWTQAFTKAPGTFVAEMLLVEEGGRYLVDHVMVW